ncbi:FMR1-interacting protein NUFIP1 [Neocloeon triangulifer]|uniref:FMR1-interacting protein NUFIP1 n=1 Tax=Neocloeon triangulifer TaxID=2078957 RepID=UPI00286F2C93|nr:FMR1-interacting protein NUFIP1 [Neocloeon triangulifer]
MSFPFLRTVPPPPPPQNIHHERNVQPFLLPPGQFYVPANPGRGRGRGSQRGRGWSRKLPNFNNNYSNYTHPVGSRQAPKVKKLTCDTCDRDFASPEELSEHISQHQVCGQEGCTFTAHPKVVAKHIEMQHTTGLYARMKKEADQWIEARKNRYPTKDNIIKKVQEQEEKIARGEKLFEPKSRFGSRGRGGGWRKNGRQQPYQKHSPNTISHDPVVNETLKPNVPEPELAPCSNNKNLPEISSVQLAPTVQTVINPLTSLVGQYKSDDSDSDSPPEEVPVSRELIGPAVPTPLVTETERTVKQVKAESKPLRPPVDPREQFMKRNRPPTLLQKLLEPEIRRERNILLQCVHYVVQNNFFKK